MRAMKTIKLDKQRWVETPHTHCILAIHENRPIGSPIDLLERWYDEKTAKKFNRAIHRFDIGHGGIKSRATIEELAKLLGYEVVEWT